MLQLLHYFSIGNTVTASPLGYFDSVMFRYVPVDYVSIDYVPLSYVPFRYVPLSDRLSVQSVATGLRPPDYDHSTATYSLYCGLQDAPTKSRHDSSV